MKFIKYNESLNESSQQETDFQINMTKIKNLTQRHWTGNFVEIL